MNSEFRRGDLVRVRRPAEILATLDERGELDAMPFMPEMVPFCGQRFTVSARAERVCDTIGWSGSRSMADTVLLEDLRCDGGGHDGCAAECRIYWKSRWLEPVLKSDPPVLRDFDDNSVRALLDRVSGFTMWSDAGSRSRYRCQATQAIEASAPLSAKDPRSYLRVYRDGNVSLGRFVRVMARAVVMESAKKLRLLSDPPLRGAGTASVRTPQWGLQPGDWVRVKSRGEIEATLNDKGKNRGLWFDREMLPFCGQLFTVRRRVDRLIDDRSGQMIELTGDCVTLEGAACSGELSVSRWFCPRAILPYWREGWLERAESPIALPGQSPVSSCEGCVRSSGQHQ